MNQTETHWRRALLSDKATIGEAIQNLNDVGIRIVLMIDEAGKLQGTISDGDIRRGLLMGLQLDSPITGVIHENPLVVSPELGREFVMKLMVTNRIQQIPVVDTQQHVVGLHLWDEINSKPVLSNLMVIMAGGRGTRLQPETENCPKPLLRVSGKPILEHIIERAKIEGFNQFVLAVHYLGHMIEEYFGTGERLGVEIRYLREESPLGTVGALALLNPIPNMPFVVTNGDVITDIQYGELINFHSHYSASATMAVRAHEWQNPFGVVQTQGVEIIGFEEKPIYRNHINAGVYVLDPSVLSDLEMGVHCDMPTLFERLRSAGKRVIAYPVHERWMDVGRPDDFLAAKNLTVLGVVDEG